MYQVRYRSTNSLKILHVPLVPTNTPRVFQAETTWCVYGGSYLSFFLNTFFENILHNLLKIILRTLFLYYSLLKLFKLGPGWEHPRNKTYFYFLDIRLLWVFTKIKILVSIKLSFIIIYSAQCSPISCNMINIMRWWTMSLRNGNNKFMDNPCIISNHQKLHWSFAGRLAALAVIISSFISLMFDNSKCIVTFCICSVKNLFTV